MILNHGDDYSELLISNGSILLENGVIVNGYFASSTMRTNDDIIEYLFLTKPTEIRHNNKITKKEGRKQKKSFLIKKENCLKTSSVMFRCYGCHAQFCFCCQKNHGINNCTISPEQFDYHVHHRMSSEKFPGMAAWEVICGDDIQCGSVFTVKNKMGILLQLF
jgi:hypothetical protein